MKFQLDAEQQKKVLAWQSKHKVKYTGAIGGRYTYSFHPTSLGVVTKVRDELTQEELDVSDYTDW